MNTKTKILTSLAVAAVMGTGVLAFKVQASPLGNPRPHGAIMEKLATLGVTDEQKAQIKEILQKHQPDVQPLIKQFVEQRRTLRDAMHGETVDEAAIRAQVQQLAKTGADLAVQRAQVAHEIRAVLTPEQVEKLKGMRDEFDAKLDDLMARVAKRIAE